MSETDRLETSREEIRRSSVNARGVYAHLGCPPVGEASGRIRRSLNDGAMLEPQS